MEEIDNKMMKQLEDIYVHKTSAAVFLGRDNFEGGMIYRRSGVPSFCVRASYTLSWRLLLTADNVHVVFAKTIALTSLLMDNWFSYYY